jgi:long-chain acyl-CoA synthetase
MLFPFAKNHAQELAVDDLRQQRSWAALENRSWALAHYLRDTLGLPPGEHAALLMGNRVECIEICLGAMLSGIWLTPINSHLSAEEVQYILDDCDAKVLFSDEEHQSQRADSKAIPCVLAGRELDNLLANASTEPFSPEEPAGGNMLYTSGTSGRPKGVIRSLPPTLRNLLNGAPLIIMPRWNTEQCLELIATHKVRHSHMVPTMFVRLLALPEETRSKAQRSSLERVLHGAAPISLEVKRKMFEWWGPVFVEYWGATEGGTYTLADSSQWLSHPGTVGQALPHYEVYACDKVGKRLPANQEGQLFCRHRELEQVFRYYKDSSQTKAAHPEPHVFSAGDIGRVDEDGFVYLCDRKSNMLISGGVNIYPAEIERILINHPAIADVCVFGVPDQEWGESVKAAIECFPGIAGSEALRAEILAFAAQHLANYKRPRSIDFHERLPRQPNGKLATRSLRDPYWAEQGRKI